MFSELKLPVILQGRQWFRRWSDSRGAPGGRGWILSSIHSACQSVLEQKPASVCVRDCEKPACTLLLRFKAWWQHKLVFIPDVQSFLKVPYWAKLTKVFRTIACLQTVSEHFRNGGEKCRPLLLFTACWPKKCFLRHAVLEIKPWLCHQGHWHQWQPQVFVPPSEATKSLASVVHSKCVKSSTKNRKE